MTVAALIANLVLSAVFAVAAVSKLADLRGTRRAVVEFGTPARLAWPLAVVLPLVELGVAGLLLPPGTALVGLAGALALLAVFSAAIAYNLARGRTPDCHCFGQLHSKPAGARTLLRNAGLAAIAVFALAASWLGGLSAAELLAVAASVVTLLVVSVGGYVVVSILRAYGDVLVRLERIEGQLGVADEVELPEIGHEPGTPAPAFALESVAGRTVSLEQLLEPELPVLLVFTSPTCGPCRELLPDVAAWQKAHAERVTIAFASEGEATAVRREAAELGLAHVLVDAELELYEQYRASGTPSAVLIAADGTIASWVAPGRGPIERLVADLLEGEPEEEGLPVGTEVPTLELKSLEGEPVALASVFERDTLLLFWNPECGYCRSMHEDVLAFERSANGRTPQLVVVASGDLERVRAEGFRSRVLIDERLAAGDAFRALGTPMGVLVADGRVASDVAAGAEAVFALARGA